MMLKCPNCKNYLFETDFRHGEHKGILFVCYVCRDSYMQYVVNKLKILEKIPLNEIASTYGCGEDYY